MDTIFLFIIFIILLYMYLNTTYEHFHTDIPTYLVSMEKDVERRKNLFIGVTPYEYSAVNGEKLVSQEELKQSGTLDKNINLKKGVIGCYMSHYNILNKIKNYNDPFSLMLEDDVVLNIEEKQDVIKRIVDNAPDDWEIIFIGHNYYQESEPRIQHPIDKYTIKKIKYIHGTQSYLVKHTALRKKVKSLLPIKDAYDIALPKIFNCYIVDPQLTHLSEHANVSNTEAIN